ncbi:MAG TPA: polysaccharide biosynthesis tyrosine autokinase [Verrucomicrobiae bacterium]|nr:polysaccharide biosynthesis tyrosine autokinase [Verrucomicrobiae bacterium]
MDPLKLQPQQETRLHFLDYWRIIRIRKTVIIAVFLLVVITATLVTFILPEYFASTARIKVDRDRSDIEELTGANAMRFNAYDPYFIQTEFEIIQSETILGRVIEALDLNTKWGKKMMDGNKLKTSETLALLRARLDLRPVRNTTLIDIRVLSENANEARDLANQVAETYRKWRLDKGYELVQGGLESLRQQAKQQDEEIAKVTKELEELRSKLQISEVDALFTYPQPLMEQEEYKRYNQERLEREIIYTGRLEQFRKLSALSKLELRDVLPGLEIDPTLTELINELNAADQKFKSLGQDISAKHPESIRITEQQKLLNEKIDARVSGILRRLETEVAVLKAQLDSLDKSVETARDLDQKKLTQSRPYYNKKRELEDMIDFRRLLTRKVNLEEIDLNLPKSAQVEIIEYAIPSTKAFRPNKTLNIILGVLIGLVVGVGLAFFIEYLDTSVKTIDDVERSLQSPVLGVIPQNVGYLIEEGAESPHAEAYRVLRTNLMFARKDDKLNTVAVVSAGAGEGKSTTVLNLATVFAQSGQRVIVVDSDLRRPTLHKLLHLTNNIGLTNYLLKQNSLDEVIQTTNLPSLDFLASGKLPSSSLGILSSSQMKDLISDLKQRYDFVFFDSPPIMGVSDASILASEVDITVQVIQYRRYPQPMNIRAKQLIEKVGGNLVGIVLNNINMSQDESYYYYSGYYHDYYSKNEESEPTDERPAGEKTTPEIKQKY